MQYDLVVTEPFDGHAKGSIIEVTQEEYDRIMTHWHTSVVRIAKTPSA